MTSTSDPDRRRKLTRWVLIVLGALTLVVLLVYLRQLFLGETFILRDHLSWTLPARHHLAESLAAGHWPQWWDGIGLGVPYAANPAYGVTYPPAWLVALFPPGLGADVLEVLHVLFAGVGTALLAARLGADRWGAVVAGIVLMCSGYVGSMMVNGIPILTLAWTPWVAWATDRLVEDQPRPTRVGRLVVLSGLLGMQILSGDPAGIITCGLLAVGVVLARSPKRWVGLAWFGAALPGALLLGAAALLPGFSLLAESDRAGGLGLAQAGVWSMHPWRMVEWVWPGFLGEPGEPLRSLAGVLADASQGAHLPPSWALTTFIGAPVLLLAAAATRHGPRGTTGLLVASALLVVLALGTYTPLYGGYRYLFLPERLVRYPEKHLLGAIVLWAALAGAGFTRAFRREPRAPLTLAATAAAAFLGAAVLVAGLVAPALQSHLASLPHRGTVDIGAAVSVALTGGAVAFVAGAVFAGALALRFHRRLRPWAVPLAAIAVVGPPVVFAAILHPLVPRTEILEPPAALAPLGKPRGGRPRLYRDPAVGAGARRQPVKVASVLQHHSAMPNTAVRNGYAQVPGYDPALSARLHQLWDFAARNAHGRRFLDLYGVEYALLPSGAARRSGMEVVHSWSELGMVLLRNPGRRPRAFFTSQWSWLARGAPTRRALLGGPPTAGRVLLDGSGPEGRGTEPISPCTRVRSGFPEEVDVWCDAPRAGYVVLLDAWAPGWRATLDGRSVPIQRADELVRAVAVSRGRHRIAFRYRTPGLLAGSSISLGTVLLLAGLAIWSRRRQRRDQARSAEGAPG